MPAPIKLLETRCKGGWFIQFMRLKTETTIPISVELSKVIQEQQNYIRQNLNENYEYLFAPELIILINLFLSLKLCILNLYRKSKRLAQKFDIKDNFGKAWNFQSHQFRHTVGTRMINNGVPMHIIQRYLGHTSGNDYAICLHP